MAGKDTDLPISVLLNFSTAFVNITHNFAFCHLLSKKTLTLSQDISATAVMTFYAANFVKIQFLI